MVEHKEHIYNELISTVNTISSYAQDLYDVPLEDDNKEKIKIIRYESAHLRIAINNLFYKD